ncbi:MAG: hypothetical protein SGI83_02855 [Bacteroidota bacterium]|mgnify:CR=1 FL=1|nr:hypothetical protein [Bacteroidota bacterium]
MALNKNHEYEELDGVRCGIVEKNIKPERVAFLKELLEGNGYTVMSVPTPAPKIAAVPKPIVTTGEAEQSQTSNIEPQTILPETFTLGVTDYTFNTINAIFGRMLKTKDGHIVTMAYWQQKEAASPDEIPYYEHT